MEDLHGDEKNYTLEFSYLPKNVKTEELQCHPKQMGLEGLRLYYLNA